MLNIILPFLGKMIVSFMIVGNGMNDILHPREEIFFLFTDNNENLELHWKMFVLFIALFH